MSNKKTNNREAQPAELPGDDNFDQIADYDINDAFVVRNARPEFKYFLAADDDDKDRPDGVFQCKLMGYRECTDGEYATGGTGCTLLRIPRKVFDKRDKAKRDAREAAVKQQRAGVQGIDPRHVVTLERPADAPEILRPEPRREQ